MKATFVHKMGITCLVLSALAFLAAPTAKAQVYVINENFNSGLSSGANFASYGPGGDGTSASNGIVSGTGPDSSAAWQIVMTAAAGGSAGYAYYGAQYQNGGVTGNTSANLSDYTLSFDAKATGGSPSLNLQLQSWTMPGFGGSQTGTLNTAPANPGYGNDITLNSTYTHYSLNLGNTSIFEGNSGFLPNGGTIQIAFQLNGPGAGANGYTETLDVDNLQLTMVPEPASIALLGLGLTAGVAFLRRRKGKA
jgi:PEP-CTERM motif